MEELKSAKYLRRRKIMCRIIGVAVAVFGVWLWAAGNWSEFWISVGTVILIIGIAIWMMGSPQDYNSSTDVCAMISMDVPKTIEEFYEAFKSIDTPLGSCWLGKFYTMKQTALVWGPDNNGQFLYFWITNAGIIGYLGFSFLDNFIKEKINEPLIPVSENFGDNLAECVCYNSDVVLLQKQLKESLENFAKTGVPLEIKESNPSEVYYFSEDFKLTGQKFELYDKDGNVLYEVNGTMPLINLYIYDNNHEEIFKMTKEIGQVLTKYKFYYKGEPYGVLEKQFKLVRHKFEMDINEGKIELTEYTGSIGHNYTVTVNGEIIGSIMDNLKINMPNIVYDNAVLMVYDKKYLPLLTAMAVMVAREIARDEDK